MMKKIAKKVMSLNAIAIHADVFPEKGMPAPDKRALKRKEVLLTIILTK